MTAGPLTAPVETTPPPGRRKKASRGWWTATAIVLLPALIPPISLAWQVLTKGTGTTLPVGRLFELFVATVGLTSAVTVTALTLGTTTAWLTTRTDIPGRKVWMILAALPLVIPSYMAALTIIGATGPNGLISSWLGFEIPTPYGFVGAWLALSIFLAPMAHLIVSPALRLIDPATEEAATGLGASRSRVFFTVTLPQLRPALVSAGLMVGLYTISDFGAVSLLRFDTFTRAIFTLYAGQIDRRPAAALSLVLMVLALAILFIERRSRSRAGYTMTRTGRARRLLGIRGWARGLSLGFLAAFAFLSLVIPVSVLLFWLIRGLSGGIELGTFWDETVRSMGVSVAAAGLAALAALPVAMVTTWRRARLSGAVESTTWAIYSLPHITVGIAVVGFALTWARPLYQSVLLLVLTYVAMFLAQSVSTALVFLSVMKELPATLLLRPNGFETLAIRIWSSTGEGFYTRASAASLALLTVSIVPLLALTYRDLSD